MEFRLIERLRDRTACPRNDVALGIGDDAAVLDVPAGRQLVACTDTLVAGVHFLAEAAPGYIGWKSLAVNLSDLAAMGAEPAWVLLALTLPNADPRFVERFADGFAELARTHSVALIGGDTTQGPLSVTVTALGFVPNGRALKRGGARVGDAVFVTGTLGDAAGALRWLQGPKQSHPPRSPFLRKGEDESHPLPQERGRRAAAGGCVASCGEGAQRDATVELLARMNRPEPRIAAGLALRGVASACIDVSDGLLADLGHVCTASKVGAEIDAEALPLSAALSAAFDAETCRELALSGGDDYELCFTVPAGREEEIVAALQQAGCRATRIGRIVAGAGVRALDVHGDVIATPQGWEHFSP
ncbi:MAG: thiamine-phosphate kinase [Rhodanobacteraceae bacterium]|nr:MAG: thiamine-phosphate kinase [Rhodanobacteraceae bacterium]